MGAEVAPLLGLSIFKGITDSIGNSVAIDQQKAAQKDLQKEQNEFQHEENELDRAWQEKVWFDRFDSENNEYLKRLQAQQNIWKSQFDITNAYNVPSAQMARLQAAGINPNALVSNSGLVSFGSSSASPSAASATGPATSAPAAHSVSPSSAPSFSGLSSMATSFTSAAQMADALSSLEQTGLNVNRQKAMLPIEVEQARNEAAISHQKALLSEIETNIANAWADKTAAAQFNKLVSDSYAAFARGDLDKANELVAQAQERVTSLEGEIKAEQRPLLLANLKALHDVYKSEESRNYAAAEASKADAAESYANLAYTEALTRTENDLRAGKVNKQSLDNAWQRITNGMLRREDSRDAATNGAKLRAIFAECERQHYITDEQYAKVQKAIKENNVYLIRQYMDMVTNALPSVIVPIKP